MRAAARSSATATGGGRCWCSPRRPAALGTSRTTAWSTRSATSSRGAGSSSTASTPSTT
ncbi:hypothetical protein [Ornithinimicrobium kibberense]|uniref:hypothetical protein n=1 Tax=Ornithinimicrobium kibberense TaxID=282060 RepID=UPI00360C6CB6